MSSLATDRRLQRVLSSAMRGPCQGEVFSITASMPQVEGGGGEEKGHTAKVYFTIFMVNILIVVYLNQNPNLTLRKIYSIIFHPKQLTNTPNDFLP